MLYEIEALACYVGLGFHLACNFTLSWWDVTINHLHSLFLASIGNHLQVVQVVVLDYGEYEKVAIGTYSEIFFMMIDSKTIVKR